MAALGLALAALFWGASYPLTKFVENCPTYYIIPIRFGTAAVVLAIIFRKNFKTLTFQTLKFGFLLSFCLTTMYILNIFGIKETTSVRSAFFTSLSFLVTPVVNMILFREKIHSNMILTLLLCLAGMFLLCYSPELGRAVINWGDILCFFASVAASFHIIFVERVTKKPGVDPALLTVFLMFFIALWGLLIGIFTGDMNYKATSSTEVFAIIGMGVFCSAAAFTLQSFLERIVPANRAGIIFALEPASGGVFSYLILGEQLQLTGWLGAAVIMLSILYMEISTNRRNEKLLASDKG